MIFAFDLDGVLATMAPKPPKKWGRMNGLERKQWKQTLLDAYRDAEVELNPEQLKFHVITARKDTELVRFVTEGWLAKHFPGRVLGLHMLNESRSIENVVRFKGNVIKLLGVAVFTEDNLKVLKGLRANGCKARLIHYIPRILRKP